MSRAWQNAVNVDVPYTVNADPGFMHIQDTAHFKLGGGTPNEVLITDGAGNVAWGGSEGSGFVPEAPLDGSVYGRSSGAWTQVLPITGGVLTGGLTLAGPPANANQAATKAYVDAQALLPWNSLPLMDGTPGVPGTSSAYARGDHQHPRDPTLQTLTVASDTAPPVATSTPGSFWFDSVGVQLYVLYDDGVGPRQWVICNSLMGGPYASPTWVNSNFLPLTGGVLQGPGNLGLGGYAPPVDAQIGSLVTGPSGVAATGGTSAPIALNAYRTAGGTWKYLGSGAVCVMQCESGGFGWYTAPAGSLGSPITWTQRMSLGVNGGLTLNANQSDPLQITVPAGSWSRTRYTVTGGRTWSDGVSAAGNWQLSDETAGAARYLVNAGGDHHAYGGNFIADGTILAAYAQVTDFYIGRISGRYRILNWAANWWNGWDETNGQRLWQSPNGTMMSLDGSGNLATHGNFSTQQISCTYLNLNGGQIDAGTINGSYLHSTGTVRADGPVSVGDVVYFTGANCGISPNNWSYRLHRDSSSGNWYFIENGTENFRVQTDGGCVARSGLYSNWVQSYGNVYANNTLDGNLGNIRGMGISYVAWGNGNHVAWNWTGGNLQCYIDYSYVGYLFSDARVKEVVGPYERGLKELCQLRPVRYTLKGNERGIVPNTVENHVDEQARINAAPSVQDTSKIRVGIIAQDTETILPELFTRGPALIDGKPVDDLRLLDEGPWLLWAAINAIKELAAKVAALEAQRV